MSNASMKDQLKAFASQLSDKFEKKHHPKRSFKPVEKVKAKPRWLDYVQYGVELLKVYFPTAFRPGSEAKPLKKGIKQDLVKKLSTLEAVTIDDKACMVKSLSYYVNTLHYHKNVVEHAKRIDLDGNEVGVVTAEEAQYSNERYQAKLKAKGANKLVNHSTPKDNEGDETGLTS